MTGSYNRPRTALVVCDGKIGPSATQMISFARPFSAEDGSFRIAFEKVHSQNSEIEGTFAAHNADLLVLSRCTSPLGSHWIKLSREAGLPVIFHIDDDLLAVPASLGTTKFASYNSPERLQALRENIEGSDMLYVSTPELAERFREHGIRVPAVAGDIYCAVDPSEVGATIGPASGPVIGYMGTGGHSADLAMIMPAVCEVMDLVPSLNFELFGTIKMPAELGSFGGRVRHIAPVSEYSEFLPFLRSLGWWVGLAPLEDNAFNRCKADTKWVEYSAAGMAVVASDLPMYHRCCADGAGRLAASTSDWSRIILELIYEPDERNRMVAAAQNKLRSSYGLDRLRAQVTQIFEFSLDRAKTG